MLKEPLSEADAAILKMSAAEIKAHLLKVLADAPDAIKNTGLVWGVYRAAGLKAAVWSEPVERRVLKCAADLLATGEVVKYGRGDMFPSRVKRRRVYPPNGGPAWNSKENHAVAVAVIEADRLELERQEARQATVADRAAALGVGATPSGLGFYFSPDELAALLDRLPPAAPTS